MQSDQAPCSTIRRVEFPLSVTNCLRDQRNESSPLLGNILSDPKIAWLSKGPLLEVIGTNDGAKIAVWTFGAVVRDFKTKVTCVAEYPHLKPLGRLSHVDQLLVGLECELTGGMLCVFNLAGSRVLRAINIPSKVTAISTVSLGGEALGPLHQCFKNMSGIAAVGTNDGQILLVDLRRHDCDKALHLGHLTQWEGVRDELQSCGLLSLKALNSNIPEEHSDDHMYLHLNEKYFIQHQRLLVQFPSREGGAFMPEDPSVTSILYVPQLASLCVGFAFGSFQIWSLHTLTLVYTLPHNEPNPLVRLSFQEACDDPNAYCYLWTVRGGLDSDKSSGDVDHPLKVYGPPSANMYSLCYDEKIYLPEYGYFYKNFMLCSTGFEYDMSASQDTVGGRLVSLYSVNRGMPNLVSPVVPSHSDDSSVIGPSSNAISLCLIVWETWGPTGPMSSVNPLNTHMAIFDINQWYVDQMPSRLSQRGGPSRNKTIASYMVTYDLGNVLSSSGGSLLDVRINGSTLLQFSSVQNVEEFSRPSSLSFESKVLMERQIVHLKHPGVQRALLSNLVSSGPGALMTPTSLFHECLALGLRPLLMDVSSAMNVPIEEQRTFLLCVALEQRVGRYVCRCAREWADGRLSAAGCTLSWLLSVAWNRAAVLKQLAIRICAQLFDHSGEKLDGNAQRQLRHIVGIFHLLETLFENVVQNKWHLALNEWPQVDLQNDALKLECQYYDVLQWLVDVELLPEGLSSTVPYPAQDIAGFYQRRRFELQTLLQQQGAHEETQHVLLIDSLLNNQPGGTNVFSEWERDAGGSGGHGAGKYPPASLQALLRTFLVKDVALEVKHSVVIYVLMDLANVLDNERYGSALQNFMQFPAAFGMTVGKMRLVQAFWHLDHKAFDTALDMLLDPLISVRDIDPWQHRCIIRLLTLQGQARMALRYVRARKPPLQEQCDVRLHLSLLIANDLINDAFTYQRRHRIQENPGILLLQFFEGCEERNHLRIILQLALDDEEESAFFHYLETSKHPAADDLQVLYLLKRSRYVEALDVNQELRKKGRSGGTRDVVVNGFYKTLPSVTRKLAAHCAQQQFKLTSWTRIEKPTPLYVNPKITSPQMRYKSSLLEAAVKRSRETWAKLVDRIPPVTSNIESTPFLCTPRTKLLRQSRPAVATVESHDQVGRKRARENDDGDKLDLSQHKRSRFQRLESALAELQQDKPKSHNSRCSTYSCTDTLPLLNTPVVQRRSPSTRAKLQQQMISSSPGHSSVTPQSIIKVRHSFATKSESHQHFAPKQIVNEPELTEEESESEPFQSTRNPQKGESETDSEPGDNDEEEGPVGVSARRNIDFESDLSSSELSLSQSSIESNVPSSRSLSPLKTSVGSVLSERSLSRIVMLSEARKVGKPVHSVTFGKGSVCVYDQDQPVDSEVAVQDESSNDTVEDEPSKEEDSEDDPGDKEQSTVCGTPSSPLEQSHASSSSGPSLVEDRTASQSLNSPTFRKNLARPPIKEMAKHLSATQTFKCNDDDTPSQSKMTAILEEQNVMNSIEHQLGADAATSQTAVHCESSVVGSSISRLARPSIRNAAPRASVGIDCEIVETGSRRTGAYHNIEGEDILNTTASFSDLPKESTSVLQGKPTEVKQSEGLEHEEPTIKSIVSQNSVEMIELDDDHESDTPSEHDVKDVDGSEEEESNDAMQEYNEDSRKICKEALQNEDTEDGSMLFTDNSNIFRTTLIDDVNSDSEADSLQGEHEVRDELTSEESESINTCSSDTMGVHAVSHEPQSFNENAQPGQASIDIELNVDTKSATQSADLRQVSFGDNNVEHPQVVEAAGLHQSAVEQNTLDDTEEKKSFGSVNDSSAVSHEEPAGNTEEEHDDMPLLRLETVDLESPLSSPSKLTGSKASIETGMDNLGKGENFETANTPGPHKEPSSPTTVKPLRPEHELSPKNVPTSSTDVPCSPTVGQHNQSATLKSSSRRGTRRRTSVSTSVSESTAEGEVPYRRITRASANSATESRLDMDANRSEKSADTEVIQVNPMDTEDKHVPSVSKRNRTRSSSSSQDTPKNVKKQTRPRRSSISSAGSQTEEKEVQAIGSRKRNSSLSSQASLAENNPGGLPEHVLGKISEEESISGKSSNTAILSKNLKSDGGTESVGSIHRKQSGESKRRRKASEVADTAAEEHISATSSHAPSANTSLMEEYETSRRLTRHQRAMLAKSIEINSLVDHAAMNQTIQSSKGEEEALASDDDDRMSQVSVRSSLRLQAKRKKEVPQGSPSSTASTVINPALTPSLKRRRRQSSSDVSELNREASPASSVRRQRSLQPPGTPTNHGSLPGTPTRRSARLSALHGNSAQKSEDGESVASMSPSSITSGRRGVPRRISRHPSVSSESEQYAFAPPEVEHMISNENTGGDAHAMETFEFSPPKTIVTPSNAQSIELSGSTSKKSTRQSRASALHTIKEESSTSRISQDEPLLDSPVNRPTGRQSWYFVKPPSGEEQAAAGADKEAATQTKQKTKQGWHSAYQQRKKFANVRIPKYDDDSDDSEGKDEVKTKRATRQSASSSKQKE